MSTTRLSSKGQIVIPKAVREAHDWHTGTEFEVTDVGDALLLRPRFAFPKSSLDEVAGSLAGNYDGPAKSLEEMEEAIAREARRRHPR